nr:T9SS type B sorting domain-containing protein [uncultured Flavobacterium sp.]
MKYKIFLLLILIITSSFAQNKNKTIGFKENKGQIIDQNGKPNHTVKYLLNSSGLNVQIKTNGFSYDIYETKKHPLTEKQKSKIHPSLQPEKNKEVIPEYSLEHIYHRIDIDFLNSNPNVELIKEEKSKDYDNFYSVSNKPNGVLKVHRYQQITYKNIYPNIDVVFTVPKDTLKTVEYNFIIHPKGNISDIQLKFKGAETALVDNKIRMSVRFGEMEETLPASWTEDGEVKKVIAVGYKKIKKNVYGFESTENVSGKTVVIDPVPIRLWGTYYGGNSGFFLARKIKVDKNNQVIIAGETSSATNIATSGAFQSTKISIGDASFFAKFDTNGMRIWGSYINSAYISDLALNSNSEIYLAGSDYLDGSGNYLTTTGAHKTKNSDFAKDGILLKFDANGNQIWGTLYGGTSHDWINTISLDNQENIILAGETHSTDGIITTDAYQNTNNDTFGGCGFIAKFSPTGNRIYGSYFPGKINLSTIDNDNNLIFAGQYLILNANQPDISTVGAHQTQMHHMDGFVVKFNPIGQRIWCTYYGGDASFFISVNDYFDRITGIGSDKFNNIYISGTTNSINNIATVGAYKENLIQDGVNAFIAKFNPNGVRQWGTYYGSNSSSPSSRDKSESSCTSEDGNIYITGNTRSTTDIATPDSYQVTTNGSDEGFIAKFDTDGNLSWGTYYGGDGQDYIESISYSQGNIYTMGNTFGSTNLGTSGTVFPSLSGGNLFLAKFQDCLSNPSITSNYPICVGSTLELKASGGTNYSWTGPNGFTSSLQNPTITNATAINSGKYYCNITGTGGCDDTKSIEVFVGDAEAPIPDLTTLPTISGDCHTSITTTPTATDACAGTITATSASPLSYNLPGTYTIVWLYQDGNGNSVTQEQKVIINAQPLPVSSSPQTFCIQQNATLNSIAITGQNVKWYDALTNGNLLASNTSLQNGVTYYASQTLNGCESERTAVLINIQNTPTPITNTNQTFCSNQNPTIDAIQVTGTDIKWYDASSNGSSIAATTNLIDGSTYYATQTINNCESKRLGITVSIINTPPSPTANAFQSFCKNENASLNSIQISGQNIKWYDSAISTVTLPNDKLLVNNTTYYASQIIGCESSRIPILIRIQDTPLPLAKSNQQFCIDENPLLSNLTISGTAIKWYDVQVGGNLLLNTTPLLNGKTYFATQTINGCESERLAVTSTIQDTAPPKTNAMQSFCVQKNAKISDISILGQNINWFDSLTSSTSLSEFTLLTNGTTYYASQTVNNCESTRIPILITILDATNDECINLVDELPYPKFFTPNNDGFNDSWTIDFNYLEPNSSIRIFDRYGKLVKELRNNDSWDGTYLGHVLPATDYWFTVTRKNGSEFKSHFSLKR